MTSEPLRIKTTALTHNEEYCPVVIYNPLTHCQAEATSEMAIELPPEEQVEGEDLIGKL